MLNFSPLVDTPAQVISQHPDAIVVSVPANSSIGGAAALVSAGWAWKAPDKQACIVQDGLYVTLDTGSGGNYTFNSKFPTARGTARSD